jgi:predicted small secreted protein
MKKLISLLVIATFILTSCEGPQGPPGFDGEDGGLIVAQAFQIEVDFTAANNYEYVEPYGFEVLPSDVTLVYNAWDTDDNGNPIWRLLPQVVEFQEGQLQYNYDFRQEDVRFFLDGTIDFGLLASEWTQNQLFRVVVIPADNVGEVDTNNLDAVLKAGNITKFDK